MSGFDILGGPSLYDALVGGGSSGFDIVAPNAGGRPMPGQGQNSAALNTAQSGGQPQGAPVSGLLAGMLGLSRYGGAAPGMTVSNGVAYNTGDSGQGVQPQQAQQLARLLQGGAAQPDPNIGSAIGTGLRSLFDGVVGVGR